MTLIRLGLVPFLTLVLVACGDDGGGTDGGGDTSVTVDSGGDSGGGDAGDDGGGGDAGDDGGGGDGGGDGGSGVTCVSHLDPACGDDEYCDFPDDLCGMGDPAVEGVCTPIPADCTSAPDLPSCGCDGLVWGKECLVYMNGNDINNNGSCEAASETYICGSRACRDGMEYCQVSTSDVAGEPDVYECVALPSSCSGMTDCACFDSGVACSDMCMNTDGNFFLTCPGG
jgi:hypothetical protein